MELRVAFGISGASPLPATPTTSQSQRRLRPHPPSTSAFDPTPTSSSPVRIRIRTRTRQVTFLALGNGAPDLISSISNVQANNASGAIAQLIGTAPRPSTVHRKHTHSLDAGG